LAANPPILLLYKLVKNSVLSSPDDGKNQSVYPPKVILVHQMAAGVVDDKATIVVVLVLPSVVLIAFVEVLA
jgi:hypothetical protein